MNRLFLAAPYVMWCGILASLTVLASSSVTNADTFFHLRLGEEFLSRNWAVTDPGHLPFASNDWVPTQWLSQVAMAWTYRHFSLSGIAWLTGVVFLALAGVLLIACRRRSNLLVASVVTALALFACASGLSGRPQLISYLLMVWTVDAWLRTRQDGKPRWWLIPLTWVWAMLHGMWLLAIVTSTVAAIGVCLDRKGGWRACGALLAVPLGMAMGAALTPLGTRVYSAALAVGGRQSLHEEWGPPDFTEAPTLVMAVMLALTVVMCLRAAPVDWFTTAMILLCLAWMLYSGRTVPIAAVSLAPLLAARLNAHATPRSRVRTLEVVPLLGLGLTAAVALTFTSTSAGTIHQPRWTDSALNALPRGTVVLADWAPSGYLTWRYPHLSPVMTGYTDMYTDKEIARYTKVMNLKPGWSQQVDAYGADVALVDPRLPLAGVLREFKHWRVVHRSRDVEMLVRPTASTAQFADLPHKSDLSSLQSP